MKLKGKAIKTKYWMPGTDYLTEIANAVKGKIRDRDIIAISEKAISTALGIIVDESKVEAGKTAHLLAKYWMRIFWGYLLCYLARMKTENIKRVRNYPLVEGARHKHLVIQQAGFIQALNVWSEDGIDGSNLPYAYVSLPLKNAGEIAEKIRNHIRRELGRSVVIIIVDTDKTYSFRNFHFTCRPCAVKGITYIKCFLGYVLARFLKLKRRATPLAVAGLRMGVEQLLRIADFSNKIRGVGCGRTVWDMTEAFETNLTGVTWKMLNEAVHKPIVIVRLEP